MYNGVISTIKQEQLFLKKSYQLLNGAHSRLRYGEIFFNSCSETGDNSYERYTCKPCCIKEASVTRAKRENRSALAVNKLVHEAEVLNLLKEHPNVVSLFGVCENFVDNDKNIENVFYQLVMEQCHGLTLAKTVSDTISLDMRIKWLYEIADAMKYVHECNIIHRDLKPTNVLLNDPSSSIKLIDFDASYILQREEENFDGNNNHNTKQPQRVKNDIIGTLPYMSPEVLSGSEYGKATDVYSFGILMYEVIECKDAYYGKINAMPDNNSMTRHDFKYAVINNNFRPTAAEHVYNSNNSPISKRLYNLMVQCWETEENARPDFNEICIELENIIDSKINTSSSPTCNNYLYGTFEACGRRKNMEDQLLCITNECRGTLLAGVFDGHGGPDVALYVKEKILEYFMNNTSCLFDLLINVENDLQIEKNSMAQKMGTTASCVLLDDNYIQVGNLGDSDIVLCEVSSNNNAAAGGRIDDYSNYEMNVISTPHLPDELGEKERINDYGGEIKRLVRMQDDGNEYPYGPPRVYTSNCNAGGLAVSRAIGNLMLRPYISHIPSTKLLKRNQYQLFIILGSDGIWDVLSPREACEIVLKYIDDTRSNTNKNIDIFKAAAADIVNQSIEKGTQDNVSCVVVSLQQV